jgi:hypothetical protein
VLEFLKNAALKRIAQTAVRHGLTALGGYLVARGYATDADWASVALDLSPIVVSLVWSVIEKQADKHTLAVSNKAIEIAVAEPADSITPHEAKAAATVELAAAKTPPAA